MTKNMRIFFFDDEVMWCNIKIIWSYFNLKAFLFFTVKCDGMLSRIFGYKKEKVAGILGIWYNEYDQLCTLRYILL
jgi:hypothetical protein